MVNIVAWSGGLDSTLVLDRLCSTNKSVWAFSIVWDMINKLLNCRGRLTVFILKKVYKWFVKE